MSLPEKESQMKYSKPSDKIIFSEPLRKINFSNQTLKVILDVKIANNIHWQWSPPWAPSLPQDVTVMRRRKHRQKSTNPNIAKGRYFASSDSWGDWENSEAGVSEQAPQSEVAHSTLPLILAQGSKWKSKQYISLQNKERQKKKNPKPPNLILWVPLIPGW